MTILTHLRRVLGLNRRGSVSVEFALVLTPFVLTFAGLFEVGLYMTETAVLQNAVEISGRLVRTGQVTTLQPFLDSITQNTYGLVNVSALSVNATPYSSFGAVPDPLPTLFDQHGNAINQNFHTGTGNQVVVLVVGCRYQFLTPVIGNAVDASGAGVWTFTSAMVFRNEPF